MKTIDSNKGKLKATYISILIPLAVAINLIGGQIALQLKLPLYLDAIGTVILSAIMGPWIGAISGLLSSFITSLISGNLLDTLFGLCNVATALIIGFMARGGLFKKIWHTFLRKLYPSTKLYLCLALTLSVILFANNWYSLGVFLLGLAFIIREKFYLEFKIIAVTLTLMFISMFLINGTLYPDNDYTKAPAFVLPLLNIKFYHEGLERSITVYRRVAPLMCTLFLLFRSMNMTDLGIAMNQGGLSYRASFVFINVFQILPVLSKEMTQITDAQRSRGLETEGNILTRVKAFAPIIIPVVCNSIMKVQNQAIALTTKGFSSDANKTIYRELTKSTADYVLIVASILLAVGSIVYRIVT